MGVNIIYTGDANTAAEEVIGIQGGENNVSFQLVSTGLDAADATFFVEESNENVDASFILSNGQDPLLVVGIGNDSNKINVIEVKAKYYRIKYEPGANTAGTIKIIMP
jgi:hypothetical protein